MCRHLTDRTGIVMLLRSLWVQNDSGADMPYRKGEGECNPLARRTKQRGKMQNEEEKKKKQKKTC